MTRTLKENQKLLLNYHLSGVNDVINNQPRSYLKSSTTASTQEYIKPTVLHAASKPTSNIASTDSCVKLAREIANSCITRDQLKQAVENFNSCGLKHTAMNTVFSDGNPNAKTMLIGEAPGANEDLKGIPFCGESGQLLDKVLYSIGLSRAENLYISNAVFWRPPGNRKPTPEELEICLPLVEKHIALIQPSLLILAGSVALFALFKISDSISKCRGKIMLYKNQYFTNPIETVVIFHPSYLLRQPLQKKQAWQDMLFIRERISSNQVE